MSNDIIEIVERPVRPALSITATSKTLKIPKVMSDCYGRISARIERDGLARDPGDMPFCIYHGLDWDRLNDRGLIATFRMLFTQRWDLELGIPVSEGAEDADGIMGIEMPSGPHIKAIHMGPYMKVAEAYARLRAFAAERGLKFGPYSMEIYANDPTTVAREEIRTEVYASIG